MTTKEFARLALRNGHTGYDCKGWDWIKTNLEKLDYIFKTEEYKKCNGHKYKCMEFLEKGLDEEEKRAISTAWYLNNDREDRKKKEAMIKKFNDGGFSTIEPKEEYNGRKIEFIFDGSESGYFGGSSEIYKGKLFWSSADKKLMAMKSRNRRQGYWINNTVFVKFIN